jgi:hypothetical protein
MLLFQWNALRVGDRVMVHDDLDPSLDMHVGTVRLVQTRPLQANEIAIRLADPASGIVSPRRHAVHLLPIDPAAPCWRCLASAASPTDADGRAAA